VTCLQLDDIVAGLSADKWRRMLPAVEDNFNRAKQYGELLAKRCLPPPRCINASDCACAQETTGIFSSLSCCLR
jgi:hypothetical protein